VEKSISKARGMQARKHEGPQKKNYLSDKSRLMKTGKVNHSLYIGGVVLLILGAFDPLEGSILIAIGSLLLATSIYRKGDAQWKFFQITFIMITVGVTAIFYLSSLGGFGGNSPLSWWWGLLILPYPVGWVMDIVALIIRSSKKKSKTIA
jgi:hypothetical protein